jgi:hypothetical protein
MNTFLDTLCIMNAAMCAQALIIFDDVFGHAQANFVRYLITCVCGNPTQTLVASAIDSTYMNMHI